jgi:putative xylitol transport system ATP-binding protein
VAALLKVEGLKKSFGGIVALRDGRFELEAGAVHALCGGNGAGKSTFLSVLMRIIRRDAGKIGATARRSSSAIPPKRWRRASPSSSRS